MRSLGCLSNELFRRLVPEAELAELSDLDSRVCFFKFVHGFGGRHGRRFAAQSFAGFFERCFGGSEVDFAGSDSILGENDDIGSTDFQESAGDGNKVGLVIGIGVVDDSGLEGNEHGFVVRLNSHVSVHRRKDDAVDLVFENGSIGSNYGEVEYSHGGWF